MSERALAAAYEHCRRIHAEHGRTYYLATRLLPREQRRHVWALYAFARVADELVDDPATPDPAALLQWGSHALVALRGDVAPHPLRDPVVAATWHTMREHRLDPDLVEEFLASMAMDLSVRRYRTWQDLRGYMRGSAAVIGELMAPLLGAQGADALRCAGLLGEAFQLTNFIRDIGEDHARGRVYLPLEDLQRHGVSEDLLAGAVRDGVPAAQVRALVAFEVRRAQGLYDDAQPGLCLVAPGSRPCLETAFTLYRRILTEVTARDGDVFAGRVHVASATRLGVAGSIALRTVVQRTVVQQTVVQRAGAKRAGAKRTVAKRAGAERTVAMRTGAERPGDARSPGPDAPTARS